MHQTGNQAITSEFKSKTKKTSKSQPNQENFRSIIKRSVGGTPNCKEVCMLKWTLITAFSLPLLHWFSMPAWSKHCGKLQKVYFQSTKVHFQWTKAYVQRTNYTFSLQKHTIKVRKWHFQKYKSILSKYNTFKKPKYTFKVQNYTKYKNIFSKYKSTLSICKVIILSKYKSALSK